MSTVLNQKAFQTQPVRATVELDDGPGRYRIGLIALASDHVTERDFMNMRPNDDVVIYTSRVLNVNPCTVENLLTMGPRLTEAASLILPQSRLDVIAYSCTSGTTVLGYDTVAGSIRAARPNIPCVTPITAACAGFEVLGVKRVAVLTPYIDEVNLPIQQFLMSNGLEVTKFTSFGMPDDNDMAHIPPETIYRAAVEANDVDAEALFISCTAIRAVEVIDRIEAKIGKPVVSAVQALFWQSLREAGYTEKVTGYGELLCL
ncbi:MAG: hypothetical protein OEU36_22915 [Gammaproteobacteria bacterium]|nr:hypothetical protein [Gammaproteobacteria bacterium]